MVAVAALSRAEQEGLSHLSFLELILGEPAVRCRQRAVERRIREARFREEKTLDQFDWKFNAQAIDRAQIEQLATGEFGFDRIERGECPQAASLFYKVINAGRRGEAVAMAGAARR